MNRVFADSHFFFAILNPHDAAHAKAVGRDDRRVNMPRRKWLIAVVLLLLYVVTWVGGWITHARDLDARAKRVTAYSAHVDWCFPVLPGLLVTDSGYTIAPKHAESGIKVVLFYGIGSVEIVRLVERKA
jgi:hypothetical protein